MRTIRKYENQLAKMDIVYFGYDPGPMLYMGNLTKAVAKSIERHLNKTSPDFIFYNAEPEPERWV